MEKENRKYRDEGKKKRNEEIRVYNFINIFKPYFTNFKFNTYQYQYHK